MDPGANLLRRVETAGAARAGDSELVRNRHHSRPDVIEKLNFHDGLDAAQGHADGAADDVGFGQRRIEYACGAESPLQAPGSFENAALAFDVGQVFLAATVGDVFAED